LLGVRVLLSHESGGRLSDLELAELTVSRKIEHDRCKLNPRGFNLAEIITEAARDRRPGFIESLSCWRHLRDMQTQTLTHLACT
jgi:hypothetical protein